MYTATVSFTAKGQDNDFDMEGVITYRNVKSVAMVDAIAGSVMKGLFSLGGFEVKIDPPKV